MALDERRDGIGMGAEGQCGGKLQTHGQRRSRLAHAARARQLVSQLAQTAFDVAWAQPPATAAQLVAQRLNAPCQYLLIEY